jgi:hypothetical protein
VKRTVLVGAGLVLTACVVVWVVTGDQTAHVTRHLLLHGAAFAAYVAALRGSRGLSRGGLAFALVLAGLWRTALVAAPPLLSDDVNRYVWEGRIQRLGGNPFAWGDRPEAERWAALRDGTWAGINHKEYTAVYPPLWQLAAWGVVCVSDSVTGMKAFLVVCEIATLGVLAAFLRRRGLPPERLLILAWSPLALVEIAGSGHNEALGMLLLSLSVLALEARKPLASALAAALGFDAKIVPGLVAAAWARRYRPCHVLAAAALAAALVVPYASAGAGLWHSLGKYGTYWRFNETVFALLAGVTGSQGGGVALALALLVAIVGMLAARGVEPVTAGLAALVAWLLLSANVLPWYALWLLPLLVVRDFDAALLFTGTVPLAYLVYPVWLAGGPWHLGWDVRILEYGPCVVLALGALRGRALTGPRAR